MTTKRRTARENDLEALLAISRARSRSLAHSSKEWSRLAKAATARLDEVLAMAHENQQLHNNIVAGLLDRLKMHDTEFVKEYLATLHQDGTRH